MLTRTFSRIFLILLFVSPGIQAQGNDLPGNFRLLQSSVTVNENAGSITFSVLREGGDDGAISVSFLTSDGGAMAGTDYLTAAGTLQWPDDDDDPRSFTVNLLDDAIAEDSESFNVMLTSPTGGAGLGSPSLTVVTIVDEDLDAPQAGTLQFSSTTYSTAEGNSTASISVQRTNGSDGATSIDFQTGDGSAVASSDYAAIAGTLTWADGESGSKSFDVGIFDDSVQEATETVNLFLTSPTGGATLGNRSAAVLSIADNDTDMGACTPDTDTLCLGENGRFRVEVTWATRAGETGVGQTFDIGLRDSGLFYFFNENNIELLVKVLDACNLPQNSFWVFFAATTDLEFQLTVTDTVSDITKIYENGQGMPADAVTDTQAFLTCP